MDEHTGGGKQLRIKIKCLSLGLTQGATVSDLDAQYELTDSHLKADEENRKDARSE